MANQLINQLTPIDDCAGQNVASDPGEQKVMKWRHIPTNGWIMIVWASWLSPIGFQTIPSLSKLALHRKGKRGRRSGRRGNAEVTFLRFIPFHWLSPPYVVYIFLFTSYARFHWYHFQVLYDFFGAFYRLSSALWAIIRELTTLLAGSSHSVRCLPPP